MPGSGPFGILTARTDPAKFRRQIDRTSFAVATFCLRRGHVFLSRRFPFLPLASLRAPFFSEPESPEAHK